MGKVYIIMRNFMVINKESKTEIARLYEAVSLPIFKLDSWIRDITKNNLRAYYRPDGSVAFELISTNSSTDYSVKVEKVNVSGSDSFYNIYHVYKITKTPVIKEY